MANPTNCRDCVKTPKYHPRRVSGSLWCGLQRSLDPLSFSRFIVLRGKNKNGRQGIASVGRAITIHPLTWVVFRSFHTVSQLVDRSYSAYERQRVPLAFSNSNDCVAVINARTRAAALRRLNINDPLTALEGLRGRPSIAMRRLSMNDPPTALVR